MILSQFLLRILTALIFGLVIGVERQWRKCAAGLRTNVLVSVGAAIFMTLADVIGGTAPERIASYVVSGIGFLGAGVILKDGASIRGLNTAATLWCTAAIGAFCGMGYIVQPLAASVVIVLVHLSLRPLSQWIRLKSPYGIAEHEEYNYHFVCLCRESDENHVRTLFVQYIGNSQKLLLRSISSTDTDSPQLIRIDVDMTSCERQDRSLEKVASFLTLEKNIVSVKWELSDRGDF